MSCELLRVVQQQRFGRKPSERGRVLLLVLAWFAVCYCAAWLVLR